MAPPAFNQTPIRRRVYGVVDTRPQTPRARTPRGGGRRPWRKYAKIAAAAGAVCFVAVTGAISLVSRDLPDPNRLTDRQVDQSTKIYDRTGEHLLYEVYQNQKRTIVGLDDISPWVAKATIAVEDKNFYEHRGIRPISIARAAFNNLIGRRTGSGGASTITQQLIKNALVGSKHSYFRKVKEAILAIRLERKYSKDEILKSYLNEIPYGSTNYGIEAAAQSYFKKPAKELTLSEGATIAALAKAPSRYLNNSQALIERRNVVLRLMLEQGYITGAEREAAAASTSTPQTQAGIFDAPHFVLYVKQLLADQFGETTVDTGGLKVITTLDYDKQKMAEKIVKEQGDKFAKEANANNAALVAIDPKTGQILALVGSRDFYNIDIDGQFNVAVLGKRQPGSSFKPFVYTAAFEKGFTPGTVLYDVTTNFDQRGGKTYSPKNFDGKERGLVTMRTALQGSLNIPAVKTMYLVGEPETIAFAERFGYTTFTGDYGLSLVLGGGEVSVLEHTNAYATLASGGVFRQSAGILKVTSPAGETLYEWKETEGTEAVKPELAALTTSVLTDNAARAFVFGVNNNLVLPGRPVAAKTGTTNDSKDAWTLGYTPSLAAGVWVGNTIPKPMKAGGNKLAGVIWNQFMRAALKGTPAEEFPPPPQNDAVKPVLRGKDGGIVLLINKSTGKIAASTTPAELLASKTFLPPHDILHYVNKDDPRGEAPAFPADDPQYEAWERALEDWVRRQQEAGKPVSLEEPLTEYDAPSSPELTPTISVVAPAPNQVITSRQMHFEVKASAPRGVARVVYSLDDEVVAASEQYPFAVEYLAAELAPGIHALKAAAQDDLGNSAVQLVSFNLQVEPLPPDFAWVDQNPLGLAADDFPRVMALRPTRWNDTKDIQIYLVSGSGEKAIYNFNHAEDKLMSNQLVFTWRRSPGIGSHVLRAVLTDSEGRVVEKRLEVEVR